MTSARLDAIFTAGMQRSPQVLRGAVPDRRRKRPLCMRSSQHHKHCVDKTVQLGLISPDLPVVPIPKSE